MDFKSFGKLTREEQQTWADNNRDAMEQMTYDECGFRHKNDRGVLFPRCCPWCKGCALKAAMPRS